MAVKGLMMHQKLRGTGMVVSRASVLQPRIITAAKNRRGTGKDGEGRSEESLACARKVAMSRCWAALVLPMLLLLLYLLLHYSRFCHHHHLCCCLLC